MRLPRFRTVILPRAKADINAIGDHIANESPKGAANVIDAMLAMIDSLKRLPLRHKIHEARKSPALSVRMVPVGKYLL